MTSHDVVAEVRRALPRGTKVGHAGTLDPFATGLLLVLVGRATRAQRFLMGLPKTYRAVARLGWTSDSGDRDGRLEHTGRLPGRLEIPVGDQLQRPPAYSAVKVGGERAYARARRGEVVETEPRPVTVYRAELLSHEGGPRRVRDRVLGGHLRAHAGLRPRRRLLRAARAHRDRALPARGRRPVELPLEEALAFLPRRAARARPRQRRRPARAARAAGGRRGARGQADGGRAS